MGVEGNKRSGEMTRISSRDVFADAVRPDLWYSKLKQMEGEGYSKVYFKANISADPDCASLDGSVYDISTLTNPPYMESPLFITSHTNCMCEFLPLEDSKQDERIRGNETIS